MMDAGGLTIGGLLVIVAWGGGWLVLQMVHIVADEIGAVCGAAAGGVQGGIVRRPRPRDAAAYHHAADHDVPCRALIRVDHGAVTHWYDAIPAERFVFVGIDVHGREFAADLIARASGKSQRNTIRRGHD